MAVLLWLCLAGSALAEPLGLRGAGGRTPGTVGTLQYDNDIPFSRDDVAPVVGNRFNVGVVDPHSIASLSFRMAGAGTTAAFADILDVNPTAMTLDVIGGDFLPGISLATSGTMLWVLPLDTPVVGHSGSFLAVLTNFTGPSCVGQTMLGSMCNGVALTSGAMDPGMGFHAVRVFTLATSGVDIPSRNAILRVRGDNLPVELMSFGVD